MIRTMNVTVETQQEYGIATFDLAVAIKAYCIQALESPRFDRLLILLGHFHIELALFGAIGTYINESGAEYLLTEAGVLAEGSLMGFIRGKFYNRCTRVHEILAVVMERKLYAQFVHTVGNDEIDAIREILNDAPSNHEDLENYLASPVFEGYVRKYESYFNGVLNGSAGPTAEFWAKYVYMVNRIWRYLQFCVRTNDVDGYICFVISG